MQAQAPKRDATWDIARGLGMILVIYGHVLEPLYPAHDGRPLVSAAAAQWQVIYSFHMMLFFLVSGAVNKSLPGKAWPDVLRGSLRLLTLAWTVHFLGWAFGLIVHPESRASIGGAVWNLVAPILEGYSWSVGVLWFLTSLCFVQILAYWTLRLLPAALVLIAAVAVTAVTDYVPEQYLMKTWAPGLAFFVLGFLFSQWKVRWTFWPAIPLAIATVFIARANHGCTFSFSEACGSVPFSIRMFMGSYGYLPVFFLSSLVGSAAVISLSAGLAKFPASELFAYMGRKSLELFFINGFWITFLWGFFWDMKWPELFWYHYLGMFLGAIAIHLLLLQILGPVLAWINAAGQTIANVLARVLTGGAQRKTA
jgi:fucose 4-O-acetylase-like acetyltransferase